MATSIAGYCYYNEIDPFAAAWLRELIAQGHIAPGVVDERSIEDVRPDELAEFTQCHFFAGIGVWSYALRRAGWPDGRPVWTGSCPCQPFSAAGKGGGFADERHLWPSWYWLIEQCRPAIVFGEQVASKAVEPWIDLVQADMEAMDYAFGCVPFPSAGVGAPHIRDRAYWVANAGRTGLAERVGDGRVQQETLVPCQGQTIVSGSHAGRLADAAHQRIDRSRGAGQSGRAEHSERGSTGGLADAADSAGFSCESWAAERGLSQGDGCSEEPRQPGPTNGFWRAADWLHCRDGKWRPVEPGTSPLVDGAAARVGRLRGYGNAINAEAAAVFVRQFDEHTFLY